jgi:hypothetical protein
MAWKQAPRPGQRSWAVVPEAAKPGMAGLGRAGLGWAGLRERRIFSLQAHKCLYWARPLVSLGGDQESLQICHSGLNCFPLSRKGLCPFRGSSAVLKGLGLGAGSFSLTSQSRWRTGSKFLLRRLATHYLCKTRLEPTVNN